MSFERSHHRRVPPPWARPPERADGTFHRGFPTAHSPAVIPLSCRSKPTTTAGATAGRDNCRSGPRQSRVGDSEKSSNSCPPWSESRKRGAPGRTTHKNHTSHSSRVSVMRGPREILGAPQGANNGPVVREVTVPAESGKSAVSSSPTAALRPRARNPAEIEPFPPSRGNVSLRRRAALNLPPGPQIWAPLAPPAGGFFEPSSNPPRVTSAGHICELIVETPVRRAPGPAASRPKRALPVLTTIGGGVAPGRRPAPPGAVSVANPRTAPPSASSAMRRPPGRRNHAGPASTLLPPCFKTKRPPTPWGSGASGCAPMRVHVKSSPRGRNVVV